MKLRASAPTATMIEANRNAVGGTTANAAAVRSQGIGIAALGPPARRRVPSRTVSDMEARLRKPVSEASVATASTFPAISAARSIGADSVVSSVLRSRSPAVMSMAGWNAPSITITTTTSGRTLERR